MLKLPEFEAPPALSTDSLPYRLKLDEVSATWGFEEKRTDVDHELIRKMTVGSNTALPKASANN